MRPRQFDTDDVLERVMNLFMAKGYEATSMRDLVAETGLHRASLYAAFGNKQQIFQAALDRYIDEVVDATIEHMRKAPRARAGIEQLVRGIVNSAACGTGYHGCLMVNTTVEASCHNEDVVARLRRSYQLFEQAFSDCVARAQRQGDIDSERDPVATARFLIAGIHGLQSMAKAVQDREVLEDAAAGILSLLG